MLMCFLSSTRWTKKSFLVTAVDFQKAFDSVSRVNLIRALLYYKCDPRVIDVIASLYAGDHTKIRVNGEMMGVMKVKCGERETTCSCF